MGPTHWELLTIGKELAAARLANNRPRILDLVQRLRQLLGAFDAQKLLSDLQAIIETLVRIGWLPPPQAAAAAAEEMPLDRFSMVASEAWAATPAASLTLPNFAAWDFQKALQLLTLIWQLWNSLNSPPAAPAPAAALPAAAAAAEDVPTAD